MKENDQSDNKDIREEEKEKEKEKEEENKEFQKKNNEEEENDNDNQLNRYESEISRLNSENKKEKIFSILE